MNYGQWAGLVALRVTALAGSHDPPTLCFLNTGMGSIMTKLAREPSASPAHHHRSVCYWAAPGLGQLCNC